jgi:hypothetical protein
VEVSDWQASHACPVLEKVSTGQFVQVNLPSKTCPVGQWVSASDFGSVVVCNRRLESEV